MSSNLLWLNSAHIRELVVNCEIGLDLLGKVDFNKYV